MNLKELRANWNALGKSDPLFAILTDQSKRRGKWDKEEFFQSGRTEIASLLNYLKSLNIELPIGRAMDFGCGVGRLTQALTPHFEKCWGVDIARSMVKLANQFNQFGDKCQYAVNEASDLRQFEDGYFSFIYSHIVLQHMIPQLSKGYIAEFIRVLRPGGILVFDIPSEPAPGYQRRPKRIVFDLVRNSLNTTWKLFSGRPMFGTIEMYSVPKAQVLEVISAKGAREIDRQPDSSAGTDWIGYRYCVTK